MKKYNVEQASLLLSSMIERLREDEVACVTDNNVPALAVLPWSLYEKIVVTLEIMSEPEAVSQVKMGKKAVQEGRVVSWEKARGKLDLN